MERLEINEHPKANHGRVARRQSGLEPRERFIILPERRIQTGDLSRRDGLLLEMREHFGDGLLRLGETSSSREEQGPRDRESSERHHARCQFEGLLDRVLGLRETSQPHAADALYFK